MTERHVCPVDEGSVSGAVQTTRSDQLARQNTENLEGAVTTDGWVRTTSRSGKHERDQHVGQARTCSVPVKSAARAVTRRIDCV